MKWEKATFMQLVTIVVYEECDVDAKIRAKQELSKRITHIR